MIRSLLTSAVAALILTAPLAAQATAAALSLHGVKRLNVRVVATEEDIAAGLDTSRIISVIQSRLAGKGVTLVERGGEGTLDVNAGAMKIGNGANITFFFYLGFRQRVNVSRLPDPPFPPIPAFTWTSPVSFGTEQADRLNAHLENVTGQLMDIFVKDWDAGQRAK
jgi:hypothetical protein